MRIAIETTGEFTLHLAIRGFIETEISKVTNIPEREEYELMITDKCFRKEKEWHPFEGENGVVESREIEVKKEIGRLERPVKIMTYQELKQIAMATVINRADFDCDVTYINTLFQRGLLLITQKECMESILGVKNKGMFGTEAKHWKLVQN